MLREPNEDRTHIPPTTVSDSTIELLARVADLSRQSSGFYPMARCNIHHDSLHRQPRLGTSLALLGFVAKLGIEPRIFPDLT